MISDVQNKSRSKTIEERVNLKLQNEFGLIKIQNALKTGYFDSSASSSPSAGSEMKKLDIVTIVKNLEENKQISNTTDEDLKNRNKLIKMILKK